MNDPTHFSLPPSAARVEALERRVLLAAVPMVSINAKANGSETDPTGTGIAQFTVRRSGTALDQPLDVKVRFSPGASSAEVGTDLEPPPTTVRIRAGRSYAHFNIRPIDDPHFDPGETIVMKLWSGDYTINPARPKARVRITDDETRVNLFRVTANASESDAAGAGAARFRVTREGPTDLAMDVFLYVRAESSATVGEDFAPPPQRVTIPAGARKADFSVTPIDDDLPEDPETIVLALRADPNYFRGNAIAAVTVADNDHSIAGWWNDRWEFRAPISVDVRSQRRTDKPVDIAFNFTQVLAQLGRTGSLVENSIRVVETTADGANVLDEDVPFQFDRASNYHAASNAAGRLVFLLEGQTTANTTRHYHVYFDTEGAFAPAEVAPRVVLTDNVIDEGLSSLRIATEAATYFYQKSAGGFSSILDPAGNDWLNFHPDPGSGSSGEWRGLPNMGPAFHPGYSGVTSEVVSQGPLKVSVESSTDGGSRRVRWDFYPTYAMMTVLEFSGNYWFLYEGTPGGAMDAGDYVVRSDGTQTNIDTTWNDTAGIGSSNGAEWVYFGDSNAGRFLFLAHHETDGIEDSYFNLEGNMTVFGFGRHNNPGSAPEHLLSGNQNTFTIGLSAGGGNFSNASTVINGAYRGVSTTAGAPQLRRGS